MPRPPPPPPYAVPDGQPGRSQTSAGQDDHTQRRSVGVVVERRDADAAEGEARWQPTALIPPSPERPAWSLIDAGPGWARYYAGTADIALAPGEAENYRRNLDGGRPMAYVVLQRGGDRPGGDRLNDRLSGDRSGMSLLAVTVNPGAIGAHARAGNALVEPLPLPSALALWMDGFVARYCVTRPIRKRDRGRDRDDG